MGILLAANATKRKVFDSAMKYQPRILVADSLREFFCRLGHPAQTLAICEFPFVMRRKKVNTNKYATWSISPDVRSTYSEDGAVLLDIRKGLCYSLNPVAARVWSTVEASPSGVDLRGLVDVMETHYKVSRQVLERDITEYLFNLEQIGLVQKNGVFHRSKAAAARG